MNSLTVIIYQFANKFADIDYVSLINLFHDFIRDDKLKHISYETSYSHISNTVELWLYPEMNKMVTDKDINNVNQWFKSKGAEIVYTN
jgi:hypothetical protein